jgi:F-box-like
MTVSLDQVPHELLTHTFSFLTAKDLCAASRVCPKWHQLANDDQLWKCLCQKNYSHIEIERSSSYITWISGPKTWKNIFSRCVIENIRDIKMEELVGIPLRGALSKPPSPFKGTVY